ncbi:antibiotic biosynthesis monooxygenase [uncultured Neptuniibacter sp.]|uniref:antibiotic biosynthesis monooxygenase n=1 Tax=uncultured Neptuniibacter sp. TaxID=502143 RepID=UPI002611A442|nr:antibiotic biosynthesis monooxygenase [uncultured Neptuniibacter sp.]
MTSSSNTHICQPGDEGSITVSISRKVKPGAELAYEKWVSGVIEAASSYPGHLGTNVLRPSAATKHEYVIIYRFDSYEHCQNWEESDLRQQWLGQLETLVDGPATTQRGTGLEFWFDLPELPIVKPSPGKMAIVLIVVVYLLVMLLNIVFDPILDLMPGWLRTFCVVTAQVLLMTYLVMPRVTRILKDWLYN